MAHFVSCNDIIAAEELASMFIQNIFRFHGLPKEITKGKGSLFTSNFWQSLLVLLKIKANMSTAFHAKPMAKLNVSTQSSSSTFVRISATNRMVGPNYFPRPNLTITMPFNLVQDANHS